MYNSEALQEKWQPVLNHPDLPEITDSYKRAVTAVILENQERELKRTVNQEPKKRNDLILKTKS